MLLEYIGQFQNEFDEKLCWFYLVQYLDGLEYIHSNGVVYRDLKLDNTLIDNNFDLKICDFGLSIDSATLRDPEIPKLRSGSNLYMAPEAARAVDV